MDIKFPKLLLSAGEYRLVAVGYTKQPEGTSSTNNFSVSVDQNTCVNVIAEVRKMDSLGSETWTATAFNEAQLSIVVALIKDVLFTHATVKTVKKIKQS